MNTSMILAGKSGNRYVVYTLNPDGSMTDRTYFLSPLKALRGAFIKKAQTGFPVTKTAVNFLKKQNELCKQPIEVLIDEPIGA